MHDLGLDVIDEGQRGALVKAFTDRRPPDIGGVGGWKKARTHYWTRLQGARALRLLHSPAVQMQGGGQEGPAEVLLDLETWDVAPSAMVAGERIRASR